MKRFNPHLRPIDGRYFIDEDGIKHKAENWPALALRVANYRKRNGKPPGDPVREIEEQVCARQPDYCRETMPVTRVEIVRENSGELSKKVMRWLSWIVSQKRIGKLRRVPREEMQRRADICSRCPLQRGLNQSCGQCKETRKTTRIAVLETERRVNSQLKGCLALGEDTELSVHFQQTASTNPELPAECWRRTG